MCAKYKIYIKENILIQSLIITLISLKYSISLWDSINKLMDHKLFQKLFFYRN